MGALHQGHLSLIEASRGSCDLTCVSVFVNPRQFNDPQDLVGYPRPIESDIRQVMEAGADILFLPGNTDMYPPEDPFGIDYDPGPIALILEGAFRPGHFKGVTDVVYRLLKMTEPDRLFLGQKDFQQVAVIRKMVSDLQMPVEVVSCPTLREPNGLAMSSRNSRLSEAARARAGLIFEELSRGKVALDSGKAIVQIREEAMSRFRRAGFAPEYFDIVDGNTLQPVENADAASNIVACCAVRIEGVRLIDNLVWKYAS